MNVKNCRKCRRLFNYISGVQLCPACKDELEKKFQEVKKFIQDNRVASVAEVSEKCEVEEAQIRQWVKEERLVFAEGCAAGIVCETCGEPILTGRFCEKCKASMINTLSDAGRRPEAPQQQAARPTKENKMRFINNNR